MKLTLPILFLFFLGLNIFAQTPDKVLATANGGLTFTDQDFPEDIRRAYTNSPNILADRRKVLLEEQIAEVLFEIEAEKQNVSVEKLFETEVAKKVPEPGEAQILAVYEANRASIGNKTLAEIRPQIVSFLRREPEQKAYTDFLAQLRARYNVEIIGDVGATDLKNFQILAKIGAHQITVADFNQRNKPKLADFEGNFYDSLLKELEQVVFAKLLSVEAKAKGVNEGDIIAGEMTNKMVEFSDAEREQLQSALENSLFEKYNVRFLLAEPTPFVQNISTDDDPALGSPQAPVTVVMFSDFQCPACASVHPVLKKVIAEFGPSQIRFVKRDFPLVNIHQNAFRAARAANAAGEQGKFFEYVDLLYRNQNALDDASLKKYAAELGLNLQKFGLDLENEKFTAEVEKDMADGKSYGVDSTPTIFVNGVKVRILSAESFRKAIKKALQN